MLRRFQTPQGTIELAIGPKNEVPRLRLPPSDGDFAKSVGVTKKTTPTARERDRDDVVAKRESFLENQPSLDVRRLVFLDESGFRLGSSPRYAWAPIGHIAPGPVVGGHWQTISMIGAIAMDGIRSMITINCTQC